MIITNIISAFFSSWELFHHTYLAGWLIALLLSLLGVWIIARDQIFIGAAIAQSSTLGISVGLCLGSLSNERGMLILAVVFSMGTSLLMALGGQRGKASREAVTGFVFLVSSALAILLVSRSPHGLEEVHRLLSSSIIGAGSADVALFSGLLVITGFVFAVQREKFLLFMLDEEMAAAVGVNVRFWRIVTSLWLGASIGLCLRVSGTLYTFGCLVLPALGAKYLCREAGQMLWVTPLLSIGCAVGGFILANAFDFPPAPVTVCIFGLVTGVLAVGRTFLRGKSA